MKYNGSEIASIMYNGQSINSALHNGQPVFAPFVLDQIPDAVAAYGMGKLKASATKCLRVRRSSDNAELDIGFYGSRPTVTLTNLLNTDGNMLDNNSNNQADGWTYANATANSCVGNEAVFTPTALYGKMLKQSELRSQRVGDVVYLCMYIKSTVASTVVTWNLGSDALSGSGIGYAGPSASGNYEFVSLYNRITSLTSAEIDIQSNLSSGWAPITVRYVHLINVTALADALGGYVPTKAELDVVIKGLIDNQGYFTTKSIIDVFSKNLTGVTVRFQNELGNYGNFPTDSNSDGLADNLSTNLAGSYSLSGGIQSFSPTSQYGYIGTNGITYTVGDVFYGCAYVKTTDNQMKVQIGDSDSDPSDSGSHSGSGNFEFLSGWMTTTSNSNPTTHGIRARTWATSSWVQTQVKQMHLFNLTRIFGAGNEPSKNDMNNEMPYLINKYGYINDQILRDHWHSYLPKTTKAPRQRVVNALTVGDFKYGILGWTAGSASTVSPINNSARITGNISATYCSGLYAANILPTTGRKIYIKATMTARSSGISSLVLRLRGSSGGTYTTAYTVNYPVVDADNTFSAIVTLDSSHTGTALWVVSAMTAAEINTKSMDIAKVTVVDMGADVTNSYYNKTQTEMDALVGNYAEAYGFAPGEFDGPALLTFVQSSNGFVSKWYDQSGKGNDAVQTTASYQPRIIIGGVVDSGLYGDGVDDILNPVTNIYPGDTGSMSLAFTASALANKSPLGSIGTPGVAIKTRDTGALWGRLRNASGTDYDAVASNAYSVGIPCRCAATWTANNSVKLYKDGNLIGENITVSGTPANTALSFKVFAGPGTYEPFNGWITEAIIWPKLLSQAQVAKLNNR
jgi:hypothetical protein